MCIRDSFYPDHLVSEIQQRQMVSSEGRNVGVCAIRGNFDDAQSAVKRCFADPQLRAALNACQLELSSACLLYTSHQRNAADITAAFQLVQAFGDIRKRVLTLTPVTARAMHCPFGID